MEPRSYTGTPSDAKTNGLPNVPSAYVQEDAVADIPAIKHAERLFLDSKMLEAEKYCLKVDPNR